MDETKYSPSFETKWYEFWEKNGYFQPANKEGKENFSIVIPPPNVTGALHIGHALNGTLQDIMVRYKRMKGYNVLWVPGTDHAGIATQNMVEKDLASKGIKKEDLGREKFVEKVWEWKEKYGNRIINQIKRLGLSCDWSRLRFTMDEQLSKAVRKVFVQLYKEGLIYKDKYIINWCPRCHTALSDLEVEHKDETGKLYYIEYPFEDGSGGVVVATTRPETMFGDTAVAVNPNDERYKDVIGKNVVLPIKDKLIPIIADEYVDMEFGTGVVKITPAHDPNDFEVGRRHNLDIVVAIDDYGKMTDEALHFKGMDRFECRSKLVAELEGKGFIKNVAEIKHAVGQCYRCHTTIEPYVSEQWFVKTKPLAEPAIEAVKNGDTRFVPKNWEKTYFEWMYNIKDWCISRQLWWGHRIPVWKCEDCGKYTVSEDEPKACEHCGSDKLVQEEDVLDTWFSSALWPMSTLGWPNQTDDLKRFYPTSLLVTGFDIIFFWVARMMMMGLHFMKDVPFRDVYIHALVRDQYGQKMSKTKGNVIDPLEVVEKYGADSMRFTLAILAAQGRDIKLSEDKIEGYKRFMNKIWNAYRFIKINTEGMELKEKPKKLSPASIWIKSRLAKTIRKVEQSLSEYKFNEAASAIYQFIWHEFCDYYIEMSKVHMDDEFSYSIKFTLLEVFEATLRLLHPFTPFITEELWQKLPNKKGDSIIIAEYPEYKESMISEDIEAAMDIVLDTIRSIRNLRSENNIQPSKKIKVYMKVEDEKTQSIIINFKNYVYALAGVDNLIMTNKPDEECIVQSTIYGDIFLPVEGNIDVKKEVERLTKLIKKQEKSLSFLNSKLNNQAFLEKAPKELIEQKKAEFEDVSRLYQKTKSRLEQLKGLVE
ncbi:valine--tRNA ligase [Hippea maritima]|uniref:Valine--tRNA ligase n=1 Tax=Hippea maritima (strain ATCC 700847 / DSM 10411 / MH2) TaxID=760142 RepID=F2LW48_HIPMA|nr:valine--tRNA ligase [Hippea maritima]AEA33982.1 Valyl-tRNA synthetase [Hippea maritima DSM 10411]